MASSRAVLRRIRLIRSIGLVMSMPELLPAGPTPLPEPLPLPKICRSWGVTPSGWLKPAAPWAATGVGWARSSREPSSAGAWSG